MTETEDDLDPNSTAPKKPVAFSARQRILGVVAIMLAALLLIFAVLVVVGLLNRSLSLDEAKGLCQAVIPAPAVLLGACIWALA
jgi:signal transduction histidine kinase